MNDNEINIAIAEAVKWKPSVDSGICWDDNGKPIVSPPSYTADLNALAAAVAAMPHGWQDRFTIELTRICGSHKLAVNAPARQRAEAFLRTLGKWKD